MATKPSVTPVQWDSTNTNMTTPSAGQQSAGAANNDILASGVFNYLARHLTAWVIYLAGGVIQHPTKTRIIPGSAMLAVGSAAPVARVSAFEAGAGDGSWSFGGAANELVQCALVFDVGERITEIRGFVNGDTTESVAMKVWKFVSSTNTATQIGSTQTSTLANSNQTLTVTGLTETVVAGTIYNVEFKLTGSAVFLYRAEIDYDRVTS